MINSVMEFTAITGLMIVVLALFIAIARLTAENERLQQQLKAAVWSDSEECRMLTAENERLSELVATLQSPRTYWGSND